MPTMIFPNLPVKDLEAAKNFYTSLGFTQNEQFSDDNAVSIVISDSIVVMLLKEDFFNTFTERKIADTNSTVEVINALGVDSREQVDELISAATSAGGTSPGAPKEDGPMYGGSFFDLDGHHWEVVYMDMSQM